MTINTPALQRKDELDLIRGLCAFSVVLCHTQLPAKYASDTTRLIFHTIANGPAAVVVFFLISGFCIHYPYSNGQPVKTLPFLVQRCIRIGAPLLAATILAYATGSESGLMLVAWSLFAEIIYYFLYPFLSLARKSLSWKSIMLVSVLSSVIVIFSFKSNYDFPSFGVALTWIVGYPIWLSGCILAEACNNNSKKTISPIPLRLAITLSSMTTIILKQLFASVSGVFPLLLLSFGFCSIFWLYAELNSPNKHHLSKALLGICQFSYSLYITHTTILHLGWMIQMEWHIPEWLFRVSLISASILFSGVFYYLIELPSHKYARSITRRPVV